MSLIKANILIMLYRKSAYIILIAATSVLLIDLLLCWRVRNMHFLWIAVLVGVVAGMPTMDQSSEHLKQILDQPYRSRNEAMETLILGLIEDFRKTMVTGSGDIPVLDPLEVKHIAIDDQILPFPGAEVTINDLKVTKLSTFEVKELTVTRTSLLLQRYRLIFDGNVPTIDVDVGGYDMSVNALGMNVFGKGDAKIYLTQPRIEGNLLVAPRISGSGIFLNILECGIKFSIVDIEPHITGMFNDPGVSDFVSLFLKNLVRELLDRYEDDINDFLSATVLEYGNELLKDLNILDLLR